MKPHPPETTNAAVVLHDNGFTVPYIARRLGVARQTVRRWLIPGARERHNAQYAKMRRETGRNLRRNRS